MSNSRDLSTATGVFLRYIWASPTTCIGLGVVVAGRLTGGRCKIVDGVLEAYGGAIEYFLDRIVGLWLPGGAAAMTLGHVVIGRDLSALDSTRAHERVHVRQYERWGPLFLPAYAVCSAAAFVRRRDPYRDNRFEREAYDTT